jgi:AraC family transcriptional regulator
LKFSSVQRVREFIEANLDSSLKVKTLSVIAGLSASTLARVFRNSVGCGPHAYVMRRRLERARELLASSDVSLLEIATMTGYADQAHFTRRFRRSTGVTPRRYRSLARYIESA